MSAPGAADGEAVQALRRWQDSGGVWRVESRSADRVVVGLRRCDDGEEADRIVSADPRLVAYLAGRESSED